MPRVVELHPAVEVEIEDAGLWYEERDAGRGLDFVRAVRTTILRLTNEELPQTRRIVGTGLRDVVRWLPVDGYPHKVIYVDGAARIVIAVSHDRRHPLYWRHRAKRSPR